MSQCEPGEHDFEWDDNWREQAEPDNEIIRIPCHCTNCGYQAHEIYMFSIYADQATGERIE